MAKFAVAYSELVRSGIHALRGLGYDFSRAERMSRVLANSEAATGRALAFIRENETQLANSSKSRVELSCRQDCIEIDGKGKSLMELSPFLLDFVRSEMEEIGDVNVSVTNVVGLPFIADFALGAVKQSVFCTADFSPVSGGSDEEISVVCDGSIRLDGLRKPIFSTHASRAGSLLIRTGEPARSRQRDIEEKLMACEWESQLYLAIRGHMMVAEDDFRFFGACVRRIWVPTSDRSRAQQG